MTGRPDMIERFARAYGATVVATLTAFALTCLGASAVAQALHWLTRTCGV